MKYRSMIARTMLFSCFAAAYVACGDIVQFADYTKPSGVAGDGNVSLEAQNPGKEFSYDEGVFYFVITMTFSNPVSPGTLDTTSSYGGWSHSAGDAFGQLWEWTDVSHNYYGDKALGSPATPIPVDAPFTMVAQYDLKGPGTGDAGDLRLWLNPALGTGTEPAPDYFDPANAWNPGVIDDFFFRKGNGSDNQIDFTDLAIYDGGDSPFIPEPSTFALVILAALQLVRIRSRR